jgi:hypothetical protein
MAGSEIDPAPPIDSRAANYEVVNRIRDLVKWLFVIFGAIGGVLVTGLQVSDLGKVHGDLHCHAIWAIGAGAIGAGVVIVSAITVLLPIDLRVPQLRKNRALKRRITGERVSLLVGPETIDALIEEREAAIAAEHEAWLGYRFDRDDPDKEAAYKKAKQLAERPAEAVQRLMSYLLADKVRRRMKVATGGMIFGAGLVVAAIVAFSIFTNESDSPPVPERLSAVVVRLTEKGRDALPQNLSPGCEAGRLRAIALGGPTDALKLATVPRRGCRAAFFILKPSVGSIVSRGRPRALRACTTPRPSMPCVAYRNSAALIVGKP